MMILSKSTDRLRKAVALSGTAALMGSLAFAAHSQDKQNKPTKGAKEADKTVALSANANAARPEQPAKKKPVPWNIDFVSATHNDSTGEGEASNVTAVSDEGTNILSDTWKWNDKTKLAHATGNLKMTDPQADATGEAADVEYGKGKRILTLTNNVVILVKPKKDKEAPALTPAPVVVKDGKAEIDNSANDENSTKSARKYPATITCDKAVYEYARTKKHATLTGHFKVVQKLSKKTRTLTADYAEWFGLEERILLHGPVHIEETDGTVFDTKEDVVVFVKEGDEKVEMKNGRGKIQLEGDPEDEPDNSGATKPPADAGAPPKKKT